LSLFAFIEVGRGIGSNAADGLFFVRFGVQNLPYMYMLLGAATFVVMLTYAAGLGRVNPHAFFLELLVVIAAVLLVERAAVAFEIPVLYAVVWVTINIISLVLGTFVWTIATGVCDTRQAKRLFSLFTSAGILGGVLGNFLTGSLAQAVGTENLLILYAVLIIGSLVITREITRRYFRSAPTNKETHFVREIRVGFDFVRASPLLRLIGIGSVLFSILFFSISFPFSKIVSESLSSEAEIAGFLGTFSGIVTLATFLVSLFLANRLYTRIGIVNSLLLLPITYLAGFVLFALNFSLSVAIAVRFAQMVVLGGIASPGAATIYNIVPPEKRAQVQSFDSGVTAQIGIVLSGVLLILGERVLTTTQIFVMGMVAAFVCGYLVWRMRKGYADALLHALRAGFIDVFTSTSQGLQNLGTDTNARLVAIEGLRDSKPGVRRVSAEIIGKLNARDAVEPLTLVLGDDAAEVRSAAIHALVHLDAHDAVGAISTHIADSDPVVRANAVDALAALSPNGSAYDALATVLSDPNPIVKSRAAVALDRLGNHREAHSTIEALLDSDSTVDWIAGLDAVAETHDIGSPQVERFMQSESAVVRLSAVRALATSRDHRALLMRALDDVDARVRNAAAHALGSSDGSLDEILQILYSGSERAQDAALDALDGHGTDAQKAIVDWALDQIGRVSSYRAWSAALRQSNDCSLLRGAHYLRDLLERREAQATKRILRALALIGTPDTIRIIAKGLQAKTQRRAPSRRSPGYTWRQAHRTRIDPLAGRVLVPVRTRCHGCLAPTDV
jgi:HEAT repeat protein/predicted MFS family arabinose efflux permease